MKEIKKLLNIFNIILFIYKKISIFDFKKVIYFIIPIICFILILNYGKNLLYQKMFCINDFKILPFLL